MAGQIILEEIIHVEQAIAAYSGLEVKLSF